MIKKPLLLACAAAFAALPLSAQDTKPEYPSPPEIVAKAQAEEWVAIAPSDLLVMDLAPDAKGKARRVVIQLMPAPFSQGWVGNIRKLAAAKWWDGTSVNRVQDNYVVQWGDATEKKALPEGLAVVPEREYVTPFRVGVMEQVWGVGGKREALMELLPRPPMGDNIPHFEDPYARSFSFVGGFPVAMTSASEYARQGASQTTPKLMLMPKDLWPTHCYAMVGVGRNLSPDTGTGAELYTVIGHAPRHLDRNIALVGRVIEGIEHLSSLPRGTGPLGFYEKEEERVPITSVRLGNEISDLPAFEYLSTESASFAAYADARANRRDPFFIIPAGGADICNIPVPIRRKTQ
ncbi:peptidylprolyl isomerase [Sphingorhabdus sp.]|uniref:peptidylprolyl isomerase n=1 Tax=Sphingorhabdus sp. TaxID=1902408 RepID=UPI002C4A84AE|nr:peptidylprolyl isomerase [Sphingorhabdus sp.]HMT42700.1 peptidylprolyl isomerase [Sphingorhabdus sp.]